MKIAYLSNYREKSGYSYAARGYISALKKLAGIELTNRNVAVTKNMDTRVKECDFGNLNNVEVVFLHTLPLFYKRAKKAKTIGLFAWETTKIPDIWIEKINKETDGVVVFNSTEKQMVEDSGIDVPVYLIPHVVTLPVNIPEIKAELKADFINENTHVFYSMSELNPRKNFEDMITSYYYAFSEQDNCILYLHLFGGNGAIGEFEGACEHIKKSIGKDSYPKIILNHGDISDENLDRMHFVGDTYVSLSHGESWNIPASKAYFLNNNMILSPCSGHREFCKNKDFFVNSFLTPVINPEDMSYRNSGLWHGIDTYSVVIRMKEAIKKGKIKSMKNQEVDEYSEEEIATKFKEVIGEILA